MAKKTVKNYEKEIRGLLEKREKYSPALDMQIKATALALLVLDKAIDEAETLERLTVTDKTRYGEKLAAHPVIGVAFNAIESMSRNMRMLGLTAAVLADEIERGEDSPAEKIKILAERVSDEIKPAAKTRKTAKKTKTTASKAKKTLKKREKTPDEAEIKPKTAENDAKVNGDDTKADETGVGREERESP